MELKTNANFLQSFLVGSMLLTVTIIFFLNFVTLGLLFWIIKKIKK